MNLRFPARLIAAIAIVFAGIAGVSAQDEPASQAYEAPRTPWGAPDLQGVWDYRSITPMQRSRELADQEFYTEEQIAELEGNAARRMDEPPAEGESVNLVHAQYATDPGRFVDESRRTSLIIDPPNGRIPPLTEEAQANRAGRGGFGGAQANSYLDRTLMERCITQGFPRSITPTIYNNNIEIVQAPDHVAVIHEMIHETRIVPLDGRPFTGMRGLIGESRGHWEGDTLVIETRNFNGESNYQGSGENLVVTERFTRVADDRLAFEITLEDPTLWVQPWTMAYSMRPTEGDLHEYACHEGNYSLMNILQNARDEERAAEAGN